VSCKQKYGSLQLGFPNMPFSLGCDFQSATTGKLFAILTVEEMYSLGYDLVASCDLSRYKDHSSWFFRKVAPERQRRPVLCVAPGGHDKIKVVRGDYDLHNTIRDAINQEWSGGVTREQQDSACKETVHEFKLSGSPWHSSGEESAACKRVLLAIIANLGQKQWRFLSGTNIKGGTDSLLFVKDDEHSWSMPDLAMISLNRDDRLRLINFDEGANDIVRRAITTYFQTKTPEERTYHGSHEFNLSGSPFCTSGLEAVRARILICKVIEGLSRAGWRCIDGLDVSRKDTDKSVLLFRRSPPTRASRVACLCLSDTDHLRLLNFSEQSAPALRAAVYDTYEPGVEREERETYGLKMYLRGNPWVNCKHADGFFGRRMIMRIIKLALENGWQLLTSADVSAKYSSDSDGGDGDYPVDVHSLFFEYMGYEEQREKGEPPTEHSSFAHEGAAGGWTTPSAPIPEPEEPPPSYEDAIE